jgi:hypothetical protein
MTTLKFLKIILYIKGREESNHQEKEEAACGMGNACNICIW